MTAIDKVNTTWGIDFTDVFEDCFDEKGNELLTDDGTMGYYTDNELHWRGKYRRIEQGYSMSN